LSTQQVWERIENKSQLFIVDNNSEKRYAKGHLPGAVRYSYKDIHQAALPADNDTPLLFYCAHERCKACHKAAEQAIERGYTQVFIMPEGIAGWEAEGRPVDQAASPSAPTTP